MTQNLAETSFLNTVNAEYLAEMYRVYLKNPAALDQSWQTYFKEFEDELHLVEDNLKGASWGAKLEDVVDVERPILRQEQPAEVDHKSLHATLRLLTMIRSYRVRGHLFARLDPLGLAGHEYHLDLNPANYGFEGEDKDIALDLCGILGFDKTTPREVIDRLHSIYCQTIGIEYMHIQDPEQREWIQYQVEGGRLASPLSADEKVSTYTHLMKAENFERFLQVKYTGTKRFGIEGAEATVPALEEAIRVAAHHGVNEVVIGMAHRGRLNILTNVVKKSFVSLFSHFQGKIGHPEDVEGSGDVKYHLGTSADRVIDGHPVHLSLCPNPSHLEAVNPVAVGKVRAKLRKATNAETPPVLGILLHGDAAFAGQGVVAETLTLADLKGYKTGGTLHFIINNQIGFTTNPTASRSSPYCSDIAKGVQAPVFHVNGDDPEAVMRVMQMAIDFRQKFQADVVVDLFCYRRHGHNESDEPSFTQPLMYKAIKAHKTVKTQYEERLVKEGILDADKIEDIEATYRAELDAEFKASEAYKPDKVDWLEGDWKDLEVANGASRDCISGVALEPLREIGLKQCKVPEGFDLNKKLERLLGQRKTALEVGENIDWGLGEALAFGSLLEEGHTVRLSGQDVGRGTFSHRHAILYDQTTQDRYIPLTELSENQGRFEAYDSPLSEFAVLGFEYGYSITDPNALVIWEAQFGDFANGAQTIIDQFITGGEMKWFRMSGLVMLLPHGYEGQGPEHSSARLERFLQMCAEENIQVANCTTPANYFHILRRQLKRKFRKPLILMTPKSLLRLDLATSKLSEMADGTEFQRVLPEQDKLGKKVKRIVFCTGKVYYDLLKTRREEKIDDVALIRVEQLYPFPAAEITEELQKYPLAEIIWCQEEPQNMGAWHFIDRRLEEVLIESKHKYLRPVYVGRKASASTAAGFEKKHLEEQQKLVQDALK